MWIGKITTLKKEVIKEEILELKQSRNDGSKNILAGSPGLIVTLTQLGLIDEYQLCVHPIILGNGLRLFKNIQKALGELLRDIDVLVTPTTSALPTRSDGSTSPEVSATRTAMIPRATRSKHFAIRVSGFSMSSGRRRRVDAHTASSYSR